MSGMSASEHSVSKSASKLGDLMGFSPSSFALGELDEACTLSVSLVLGEDADDSDSPLSCNGSSPMVGKCRAGPVIRESFDFGEPGLLARELTVGLTVGDEAACAKRKDGTQLRTGTSPFPLYSAAGAVSSGKEVAAGANDFASLASISC